MRRDGVSCAELESIIAQAQRRLQRITLNSLDGSDHKKNGQHELGFESEAPPAAKDH
jgi:hypothetical protein